MTAATWIEDRLKAVLADKDVQAWVDERIDKAVKTAVAEGNKDVIAYLDSRFGTLEKGINDTGVMMSAVSRDVGGVADSVSKLFDKVLAIPTAIAGQVEDTINRINPFHLP